LTVLVGGQQIRVRLVEIDAPERKQAFGARSRQSLSDLCGRKTATVKWSEMDRYGRVLGRVFCGGIDANAEQVRRGMAWVYDRYVKDRSLYALQDEAKVARRGLWADKSPVPPWEWRMSRRER
jgi:endonuclease YncB( thermonuclease family)